MTPPTRHAESGFSILEALVSMTIFTAALTAVLVTYASSKELFVRGERKVEIQQNARWALAEMSRQIRMAGYFPENFTTPPASPALDDPIRIATDDALAFYGDADNSGTSNVFLYCVEGETLRRGRGATTAEASYNCSAGDVLAENVIGLRFNYYDEDGVALPSPPQAPFKLDDQVPGAIPELDDTTQRDQVRRVVVTLRVREALRLDQEQVYTLTSDVVMRNVR